MKDLQETILIFINSVKELIAIRQMINLKKQSKSYHQKKQKQNQIKENNCHLLQNQQCKTRKQHFKTLRFSLAFQRNDILYFYYFLIYELQYLYSIQRSMEEDKFLKKRKIEVHRSEFLQKQFQKKNNQEYNPSDKFGARLSSFWQQGDNIWTVYLKRVKYNITFLLNPDTYSINQLEAIRQYMVRQKYKIISCFILIIFPFAILAPIIRPKLARIKRQFIFQYYLQTKMIGKILQEGPKKINKQQMEKIIQQINSKTKL